MSNNIIRGRKDIKTAREKNTGEKRFKLTSIQVIMVGFIALILAGTLLLMIPASTAKGESTDFITALFTATTSICVTGLVVVDTFSHWSLLGKVIILVLIQLGGFGVITFYSYAMLMLKKKFSLKLRLLIQEYYNLSSISGLIKFLKKVVYGTFIVEGIGAFLYTFTFVPEFGFLKGIWVSVFTSVSAFCNAGIDIIGPDSLIRYQTNISINLITMFLIILGGLGFVVWFDVVKAVKKMSKKHISLSKFFIQLNEHSRLVLNLTIFLILSGAILVFIFERNNPDTIGNMNIGNKILCSIFQSVTFRTAGFASIPQGDLTPSTCLIGFIYMFIGGSPVGTAGGVKTVTVFIIVLNAVSYIRNRDEAVVFSRRISKANVSKATAIVFVSMLITLFFIILLINTSDANLLDAAYEIFSATATVGLSRGLTSSLNMVGKVIVILAMYLGRIGPISMALFFTTSRPPKNDINYIKGHFIVG